MRARKCRSVDWSSSRIWARRDAGSVSTEVSFSSFAGTGGPERLSSDVEDGVNRAKKAANPRLVQSLEENTFFVFNLIFVRDNDIHEHSVISSPFH